MNSVFQIVQSKRMNGDFSRLVLFGSAASGQTKLMVTTTHLSFTKL